MPACHRCIAKVDGYSHHDKNVFDLHFCPTIKSSGPEYSVTQHPFLLFAEIREYMDACFDPQSAREVDRDLLITDSWALIPIAGLLIEKSTTEFHKRVSKRILNRLQRFIREPDIPIRLLNWDFLPPGNLEVNGIVSYLRELKKDHPAIIIDESRITFIASFSPDTIYLGKESFDGYVCFHFAALRVAVLECSFYGNALYILIDDWEALSRLSKAELIVRFQKSAIRVIHDEGFDSNVKRHFSKLGILNS